MDCALIGKQISRKLPTELDEKATSFHSFILKQRQRNDIAPANIGNMDETPMTFDMPGNRTVGSIGEKKMASHEKKSFYNYLILPGRWHKAVASDDNQKENNAKELRNFSRHNSLGSPCRLDG